MPEVNPCATQSTGFAKLLYEELTQNCLESHKGLSDVEGFKQEQYQIIARRAHDLVSHALWHTVPASGSTIAKYKGLTIEEIADLIPDLTEWPKEE